jgi:hypothetical protein
METLDFFEKGLQSSKRVIQKNEGNKSSRKSFESKTFFCSFFVQNSSKKATDLEKTGQKFP